ncbi:MAG: SPOR domain-containing protein [Flavobacteriales bacterium]
MRSLSVVGLYSLLSVAIFACGISSVAYGQDSSDLVEETDTVPEKEWQIRPKLSIGVGMLNYQGDLIASKGYFNPFQNRGAVHVNAAQAINDYLDLNFYMLFGSLGADERTLVRNLNFSSRLTSGGVAVSYNFDHLLKEDRKIEPFVSLGIEAFEFQSKTDLVDRYGNTYNYWSDGTIRNAAEDDEAAGNTVILTRDYVYETDIRELNADGLGDYPERSFAVPFGAGANLLMGNKMSMKVGMEYHWTFTDNIDGVTIDSRGVRQGNKQTDRFLHTFVRFTYDLTPVPHEEAPDVYDEMKRDTDQDSVVDFLDNCPNTPLAVEVDKFGCPLDSDKDGVPDYADLEINSEPGSIVDSNGVAFTDADFEQFYLEYIDSAGNHSTYTNTSYSIETSERKTTRKRKQYSVQLAEIGEGEAINDSLADVILSVPEVTTRETSDGKTVVEMSGFGSLEEAVQRKIDLETGGVKTGDVTEHSASGEKSRVSGIEQDIVARESIGLSVDEAIAKNKALPAPKKLILDESGYTLNRPIDSRSVSHATDEQFGDKPVYRVQIGSYANKLKTDVFDDVKDLIVITTKDGLTRYYAGAFTSYEQAAARKIDMIEKGFDGAFVVPFKSGQRLALTDAGATPVSDATAPSAQLSDKYGKVKFKVQIGEFTGQIPTNVLDMMMSLGRIDQRESESGAIRYFTGEFNTYEEAEALKEKLTSQGFEGVSTAAEYEGRIISASEGIELLK